jgi:hypothetical protein
MQSIIDQAVKIATREAMNGRPVERVVWNPPVSATQDSSGSFTIKTYEHKSASDRAPWD